MSAERALRAARWRRWVGLPVVVALFFATSVVAATPRAPLADLLVPAPSVLQAVVVPGPPTMGHRPDFQIVDRGGHGRTAPDPTMSGWSAERAGTGSVAWWHRRCDSEGHRAQAGREVYQVRGPPGRRAPDALS